MYDLYYFALSADPGEKQSLMFTVTLVDDDPLIRETMKDYLTSMKITDIETYASGEEFLAAMKPSDKRFVVCDFDFGSQQKMNGMQVLEEIKKRSPEMPVIILSAQDKMSIALEVLRKGAIDYFIKGSESTFTTVLTSILKMNELLRMKKVQKDYFTVGVIGAIIFVVTIILSFYNRYN
jgi:two-component system, NtrC family, response regulator AtoC